MLVQATITTLFALLSVTLPVTALATPRRISDGVVARQPYNPFHSPSFDTAFKPTEGRPVDVERKRSHGRRRRSDKMRIRKRKSCAAGSANSTLTAVPSSTVMVSSTIASAPTAASSAPVAESFAVSQGSSSTLVVQNAPVITPTSSRAVRASSSVVAASSTASSSSSAAPAATSSVSTWTSVDTEGNGPFAGSATYYNLGTDGSAIGACGTSLVDSDLIAAASYQLYDNWPGATANPNTNPICGQYAKVSYQGASVTVRIADECPGCDKRHLDLSPSAFTALAAESVGMMDVTWEWVEGPDA